MNTKEMPMITDTNPRLRRFCVQVCSTIWEYRYVEVEAEDEGQAGQLAVARVCDPEQPEIPVSKLDGNGVEAIGVEEMVPDPVARLRRA